MMRRYKELGTKIGNLVDEKQAAYGDAIAKTAAIMRVLYPNGIPPEKTDDMLLVVRVLDKLCRITGGDKKAFGENPWQDIAGYGLLGTMKEGRG